MSEPASLSLRGIGALFFQSSSLLKIRSLKFGLSSVIEEWEWGSSIVQELREGTVKVHKSWSLHRALSSTCPSVDFT